MSMFSFPTEFMMSEMMKPMSSMADWTRLEEMRVSPLMVYPLGATAAATAIGFGLAGQMAGLMIGAMQGAMKSQASLLGGLPDPSWMPAFAKDLAPEAGESDAVADVQPTAKTKTADIVELKPAPQPVAARAKAKSRSAKAVKPKAASAKAKADTASAAGMDTASAVVDKLKSDAELAAAAIRERASVGRAADKEPAATLAPEHFRRPAEIAKPEAPDDLKLIAGVGPKLEQVLNRLGVWTFAQIAAWQPEEVAWVDDYLQFRGRIDRDGWISQAGALARGGATAE
ncbi:hypothetical protein PZ897_04870 [Hoeflea sp. YIM 152468]|uniref:hypothetical protein n=1 Tax=Hoeflea sp. YIM 152468 TaxID=3031759 RepID=UPI0023DA950B|nr:hypothetical protein [Hoeflea sp. YIM 152468]MDF1607500.1 hypothetical protein [Hoeflea sp. YIM 152468]